MSACGRGPVAPVAAQDGVAIALYSRPGGERYAVVDDRRWVDVAGGTLVLDRIAPGAALPSLLIEPLGAGLQIGTCLRERIEPPPPLPSAPLVDPIDPADPDDG